MLRKLKTLLGAITLSTTVGCAGTAHATDLPLECVKLVPLSTELLDYALEGTPLDQFAAERLLSDRVTAEQRYVILTLFDTIQNYPDLRDMVVLWALLSMEHCLETYGTGAITQYQLTKALGAI